MLIKVRFAAPGRLWHLRLLQRLAARPGVSVCAEAVEGGERLPAAAGLLFTLERLIHRLPASGPASEAQPSGLASYAVPAGPCDLTIDLAGGATAGGAGRVWTVTFDGGCGDVALLGAVLSGRAPVVAIEEAGRVIASGRPGTEYGGIAVAAFEDALRRTTTLILAALDGAAAHPPAHEAEPSAPPPSAMRTARIAAKEVARTIVRHLYRLCYHSPHWRVGWRRVSGPDVIDLKAHPAEGWRNLADDGLRFYADPFPVSKDGRMFLFVEDFAHRLGKGIVSAVEFGADGPLGAPVPVLETPVHLSYPFVFEREGEMWMIPESCGAGTVDLYRATRFPGGWVKEATLLSGIVASDATLVEQGGRWWMFATVQDEGGAFSDSLHLWSAPDFRGPWTPHARNPVLVDIASARPAGRMAGRNGALWRPVQDCRDGYGAALGLARVTRLDDGGYAQTVETVLRSGPLWPGRRLHTLNREGWLEVIDGSGRARLGR